jgi:hypothetical protein
VRPWLPLAVLAFLPAATAAPATLTAWIDHPDTLLTLEDTLPFRVGFNLTCGDPAPSRTEVWLEAQSLQVNGQEAYNVTFGQARWTIAGSECGGTVRRETTGRFRFLLPMEPFRPVRVQVSAWAGLGPDVWAQGGSALAAVPDATFSRPGFPSLVGAAAVPGPAERRDGRIHQSLEWTLTNHGRGAFEATLEVESLPDWMRVESLPRTVASGPDAPPGARAVVGMVVSMPAACPAPSGALTLLYTVRSPEPRSHARAEARTQATVPCDEGAGRGTPAPGAALLALVGAAALLRRAADARHKR